MGRVAETAGDISTVAGFFRNAGIQAGLQLLILAVVVFTLFWGTRDQWTATEHNAYAAQTSEKITRAETRLQVQLNELRIEFKEMDRKVDKIAGVEVWVQQTDRRMVRIEDKLDQLLQASKKGGGR